MYVHKTEALRASGPPFFSKRAKHRKKATTTHQELQKRKQSTIYTQDPQLQGGSECMLSSSQCPNKLHQCSSLSPLFSDKLFSLSGRGLQCFAPHCASHVHASVEEGGHTPAGREPGMGNCQTGACQVALGMRLATLFLNQLDRWQAQGAQKMVPKRSKMVRK